MRFLLRQLLPYLDRQYQSTGTVGWFIQVHVTYASNLLIKNCTKSSSQNSVMMFAYIALLHE